VDLLDRNELVLLEPAGHGEVPVEEVLAHVRVVDLQAEGLATAVLLELVLDADLVDDEDVSEHAVLGNAGEAGRKAGDGDGPGLFGDLHSHGLDAVHGFGSFCRGMVLSLKAMFSSRGLDCFDRKFHRAKF
jgi:hypothetical protein